MFSVTLSQEVTVQCYFKRNKTSQKVTGKCYFVSESNWTLLRCFEDRMPRLRTEINIPCSLLKIWDLLNAELGFRTAGL